jgi:DNA-directed RNA polymerase subunit H (RpoH/RPB5)
MTDINSVFVSTIYKTRKILIQILKSRGYIVDDYENFTIGEISILIEMEKLDFIVENNLKHKIYVKYELKALKKRNIYNTYEELFLLEDKLDVDNDELLYISVNEPNDTILKILTQIWNNEKAFINIMSLKRLQFNILKHKLVPPHRILSDNETKEFKTKFNVSNEVTELPEISRFDPVAITIGLRPGKICEITRKSRTSLDTKYYRICI